MISDESDRFNPREPKPADAGKPSKSAKRREARQLATQALYQWHMAKQSLNEIEAQFRVDNDFSDVDAAYFREILHGVPAHKGEIDAALVPCLDITIIRAPGAFEIPLVAQKVAQRNEFAAIIALGAVIRGGTPHFEYVAGECTKGLSQVSMQFGVPVAFGVLTVDSIEQAIERSGTKAGNKGAEAALSALEMVSLLAQLEAK